MWLLFGIEEIHYAIFTEQICRPWIMLSNYILYTMYIKTLAYEINIIVMLSNEPR